MRIETVGVATSYLYIPDIEPIRGDLRAADITPILPKSDKPSTLWDIVSPAKSPFDDLFNILNNIVATKIMLIQLNNTVSIDADSGADEPHEPPVRPAAAVGDGAGGALDVEHRQPHLR